PRRCADRVPPECLAARRETPAAYRRPAQDGRRREVPPCSAAGRAGPCGPGCDRAVESAVASRACSPKLSSQLSIDEIAEDVADQDVRLLDARGELAGRDPEAQVDRAGERAAVAARQADRMDAEITTGGHGPQDVRRAAAGRERQRRISASRQGL